MKHIVLFSGGANSAYVAYLVNQKHHANTILLHTPTYSEHPDADRFRKQFADFLGLPITVQSDGRDIWQLIKDNHALPSDRMAFCSRILKLEQSQKYYDTLRDEITVYYGYGGKEWRRAQRSIARLEQQGIKSEYPLIESCLTDEQIKDIIRYDLKICLPEPYKYLSHNNCLPCFKGGLKHFYQIWKYYPEYYEKAEKAEDSIGYQVFPPKTLEQLRHEWEQQIPMFTEEDDMRPCMCAT